MKVYFNYVIFLMLLGCFTSASNISSSSTDSSSFDSEGGYYKYLKMAVSPDIVDDVENDILGLIVRFPNVVTLLGNELPPNETQEEPIVHWFVEKDKDEFFTISMTDPDAPSREDPKYREWQHWLVVNIPDNKVHLGEFLTEYNGPSPPKGTGLHRYCLLVFKQPGGKMNFTETYIGVSDKSQRKNFNTRAFVDKYKLGKAVAGNFFVSQWEA